MINKIEPYKGISNTYDEIRPSYPEKLIKDIISKTGIKLGDRLLEIGAGTGKATIQFAEKGFSIHAIELDEDMAEILKTKCLKYKKVSFYTFLSKAREILEKGVKNLVMNGKSEVKNTDYSEGCNFIIGGNTLGRGVTFPGLQTI